MDALVDQLVSAAAIKRALVHQDQAAAAAAEDPLCKQQVQMLPDARHQDPAAEDRQAQPERLLA
jgi:hypothetical protein